jgi:tRNA nucleotidyltransferase (CCA-adding enzyme)
VVEELIKQRVELKPEEATLLLFGIYEDTGSFTHLGTTPRDLKAAAYLLEKGASLETLNRFLNEKLTAEELKVVYDLLRGIEYIKTLKGFRVAVATFKGEEYFPEFQELVYKLKEFTENVDGFFVIYESGNKTYVFGRANNPDFDTAEILRRLGGGGHGEASSLKVTGIPAERVKRRLLEVLKGKLPNIYLENFISSPPLVIKRDENIKEALQKLVDFGFAGAPVVDEENRPIGVIFKKDLLKALKHLKNPEKVKVEEVASTDMKVLKTKDTIWAAEEILSRFGQKLIPVVNDEGKVVGVITRLDIFKNIVEETPEGGETLKLELPENVKEFAKTVGEIAENLGMKAYIVGGVVRDIILGRPVWDLDIVVEGGSAVELAEKVAEHYGVKYHPFEEFKTAHLKVGDLKVEFATARRERYEKSGAYPEVEPASLKEDIFRRDFTINTMAIALNPDRFGELIDYLGGLKDLQNGTVRVLHSLSFVEDPVRILRGLRFAGRFGFELSKGTKSLMRRAVELGVLKNAPKGRIANELRLALREPKFLDILKLYKDYKILEQIFPEGFQWSSIQWEELKRLKNLLEEFPEINIPGWVLLVELLLSMKEEDALKVLSELSAPSKVREIYQTVRRDYGKILKTLKGAITPSELLKELKKYPDEVLLLIATKGGEQIEKLVKFYLKELKPFKVKVDVKPFLQKGLRGKELGEVIEKAKAEIIDRRFGQQFSEIRGKQS